MPLFSVTLLLDASSYAQVEANTPDEAEEAAIRVVGCVVESENGVELDTTFTKELTDKLTRAKEEIAQLKTQMQQSMKPVAARYRIILDGRPGNWHVGYVEMLENPAFIAMQKLGKMEMRGLFERQDLKESEAP